LSASSGARYQSIPQLEAEYDEAVAEVRLLNAEQKRLEEEYELKKQPYRAKRDRAEQWLRELRGHREILIRDCRCEALITGLEFEQFQRSKVAEQHKLLTSEIYKHNRRIGDANDTLHKSREFIYFDGKTERQKEALMTIQESEAEIAQLQKQVDQLEVKLAEHDTEIARIEEQMLYD